MPVNPGLGGSSWRLNSSYVNNGRVGNSLVCTLFMQYYYNFTIFLKFQIQNLQQTYRLDD